MRRAPTCARPAPSRTLAAPPAARAPTCVLRLQPSSLSLPRRLYSTNAGPPASPPSRRAPEPLSQFDLLGDFAEGPKVKVDGYNERGFLLGTREGERSVEGSVVIFPNFALPWTPLKLADMTDEALTPLWLVHPPIEIILFGTGKSMQRLPEHIEKRLKELNIRYEALDTRNACSAFNVLNAEDRRVVACLLPSSAS